MDGKRRIAVEQQLLALLRSQNGLTPPLFGPTFQTRGVDRLLPRARFPSTRHGVLDLSELCEKMAKSRGHQSKRLQVRSSTSSSNSSSTDSDSKS